MLCMCDFYSALLSKTKVLIWVKLKSENKWVLQDSKGQRLWDNLTQPQAKYMEQPWLQSEWNPPQCEFAEIAIHTCREKITNEMLNVNGPTRVINLSVATGQLGSSSKQSCQNTAAVWTDPGSKTGNSWANLQAENSNSSLKHTATWFSSFWTVRGLFSVL